MGKRETAALEILRAGGYWRKALERTYHGTEQFCYRLYTAGGEVVKGYGFQTWYAMEQGRLLQWRQCERSTVWPEEWVAA